MDISRNSENYIQMAKLGEGGYGTVYAGVKKSTNESVAIKFCAPTDFFEGNIPMEVAMLMKAKSIKGVVRFIELIPISSQLFAIVLSKPKHCIDLFDYLCNQGGSVGEIEAKNLFKQIMMIIFELYHRAGIIHRDIKDENIVIDLTTRELILVDFGAAALVKDEPYSEYNGTRVFAPPEWFRDGQYYAESSTVWTCGTLLYSMVFEKIPFQTENEIVATTQITFPKCCSSKLRNLIETMLENDPTKRLTLKQVLQHEFLN